MYKNILNFIIYFFFDKKVKPSKESLNCCVFIVGKNALKFSLLSNCLDLFKASELKM